MAMAFVVGGIVMLRVNNMNEFLYMYNELLFEVHSFRQGPTAVAPEASTKPQVHTPAAVSGMRPDGLKIAIYMTTHGSQSHLNYIHNCWPAAMTKLELLQNVDLIVYTSSPQHNSVFQSMGFRKVILHRYNETIYPKRLTFMQKQKGALTALVDPWLVNPWLPNSQWKLSNTSWFDDYDWVIRVNPDVMIRNDTWLLQQMRNPTIQGIFARWDKTERLSLHTDFFAFRPTDIDYKAMFQEYWRQTKAKMYNAETHFTAGFQHLLQDKQPPQLAFLPGVNKREGGPGPGHVQGYHAPVIHVHTFIKECPNYFDAHDDVNGYY
jgi:hypothetical protein